MPVQRGQCLTQSLPELPVREPTGDWSYDAAWGHEITNNREKSSMWFGNWRGPRQIKHLLRLGLDRSR